MLHTSYFILRYLAQRTQSARSWVYWLGQSIHACHTSNFMLHTSYFTSSFMLHTSYFILRYLAQRTQSARSWVYWLGQSIHACHTSNFMLHTSYFTSSFMLHTSYFILRYLAQRTQRPQPRLPLRLLCALCEPIRTFRAIITRK